MELDESKVTNGTAYSGISEKYLKLSKPGWTRCEEIGFWARVGRWLAVEHKWRQRRKPPILDHKNSRLNPSEAFRPYPQLPGLDSSLW
jgi:hypothetical protein